jgi:hypothetical protein
MLIYVRHFFDDLKQDEIISIQKFIYEMINNTRKFIK